MKNWKTTSAGIAMIIAGVTRLVFAIIQKNITEEAVGTTTTAVLGGIGLILSKDYDKTGTPQS